MSSDASVFLAASMHLGNLREGWVCLGPAPEPAWAALLF